MKYSSGNSYYLSEIQYYILFVKYILTVSDHWFLFLGKLKIQYRIWHHHVYDWSYVSYALYLKGACLVLQRQIFQNSIIFHCSSYHLHLVKANGPKGQAFLPAQLKTDLPFSFFLLLPTIKVYCFKNEVKWYLRLFACHVGMLQNSVKLCLRFYSLNLCSPSSPKD